jgi:hypothetical protein
MINSYDEVALPMESYFLGETKEKEEVEKMAAPYKNFVGVSIPNLPVAYN